MKEINTDWRIGEVMMHALQQKTKDFLGDTGLI